MTVDLPGYRLLSPVFAADAADAGDAADAVDAVDVGESADSALRRYGPAAEPASAGRAVMWRGSREADDATVAIKVFPAALTRQAEREAQIGRAVDHPHVLAASAVVSTPTHTAVVFPWAGGGSLANLLRHRRRLPWDEALTVLIPLADALAAAHDRGFVHGDVSADNVVFDTAGRPLLADFGAARSALDGPGPVYVTAADVAPEIARGADATAASDLFSLGSVALRCISGEPAWPADDLADVIAQSAVGQWPDVDERLAPAALCEVLRRLLAAEPADRGSARAVAHDLREIGRPTPVRLLAPGGGVSLGPVAATVLRPDAPRPPLVREASEARRRRTHSHRMPRSRWRAVALTLTLAGILAGASWSGWWWAGRTASRPIVAESPAPAGIPSEVGSPTAPVAADSAFDWRAVVTGLDAARSDAFVRRDAAALSAVYTEGAGARDEDAARIGALRRDGRYVTDAGHRITSAVLIDGAPSGDAVVEVLESLPAYPVYAAGGSVLGYTRAVGTTTVRLHLQQGAGGYRIRDIRPTGD